MKMNPKENLIMIMACGYVVKIEEKMSELIELCKKYYTTAERE